MIFFMYYYKTYKVKIFNVWGYMNIAKSLHKTLLSNELLLRPDGWSESFCSISHFLRTHFYGLSFSVQFLWFLSITCQVWSNFSFDLGVQDVITSFLLYIFINCPAWVFATVSSHTSFSLDLLFFVSVLPHKPSPEYQNKFSVFNILESRNSKLHEPSLVLEPPNQAQYLWIQLLGAWYMYLHNTYG